MADELSLGLAPKIIDEIYASLQELNTRGIAMLVVEQYVHRILELADYVYLLAKGRVSWSGASSDLDEAALVESYLGGTELADGRTATPRSSETDASKRRIKRVR